MIRPGAAVAAAVAAAITYRITRAQNVLSESARIHEGDLESHQADIDRLKAHCGIAGDIPLLDAASLVAIAAATEAERASQDLASDGSDIPLGERMANDKILDGLQDQNWTVAEQDQHAALNALFADGGQ